MSGVNALGQDSNGFLLIGGTTGLFRFDGAEFNRYQIFPNHPEFSEAEILRIETDSKGDIWISTFGEGLARIGPDGVEHFSSSKGLATDQVWTVAEDPKGMIWIATQNGLNRYSPADGTVSEVEELRGKAITHLWSDPNRGLVIIGPDLGLLVYEDGLFREMRLGTDQSPEIPTFAITDRSGVLWIGTDRGLHRVDGTVAERVLDQVWVETLLLDSEGALWIGTYGDGIYKYFENQFRRIGKSDGLTSNAITDIFEDADGAVWASTQSGFSRISEPEIMFYGIPDEVNDSPFWAIGRDTDDQIWLGGETGLYRLARNLEKNEFESTQLLSEPVWTLAPRNSGGVWLGLDSGIGLFAGGKLQRNIEGLEDLARTEIWVLLQDRQGKLWIGTAQRGLYRFENGKLDHFDRSSGLNSDRIRSLHEHTDGTIWIGTDVGLHRFGPEGLTELGIENGLESDYIWGFHTDTDGRLWIATDRGGLKLVEGDTVKSLRPGSAFPNPHTYFVIEGPEDYFWVGTALGLHSIDKNSLLAAFQEEGSRVLYRSYSTEEGLIGYSIAEGHSMAVLDSEHHLWLANFGTVAVTNTLNVLRRETQQPLTIDEVLTDGEFWGFPTTLIVPPGTGLVEIHYSFPVLHGADRLAFRHRLEGFQEEWREVGTRRSAYYTNLPPGEYVFHLDVATTDKGWLDRGKTLRFTVGAFFYQTSTFKILIGLALCLVLAAIYLGRIGSVERANRRLSSEVEKQTKVIREALQTSEASRTHVQAVLASLNAAVLVLDKTNSILDINLQAQRLLRLNQKAAVGKRLSDVVDSSRFPIDICVKLENSRADSEVTFHLDEDQDTRFFRSRTAFILNGQRFEGKVIILNDVTPERRLSEQKSSFVSIAAHELRTPLTSILGFTELLLDRPDLPGPKRSKMLRLILDQSQSLNTLISDLLNLAKMERGQVMNLARKLYSPSEIIAPVIEVFRNTYPEHVFELQVEELLPSILVDLDQIRQVMKNLISNSVKYGWKDSPVHVSVSRCEDRVEFAVRDYGDGMTTEQVDQIFEKFYRVDTSDSAIRGTGLGMSIAKSIVQAHGGKIVVDSKVGVGTVVTVSIPVNTAT